ncbi:pre-rRNA 2'-O-ribose RNA methyltransferase FTSJ3-like [Clavelina lepadiformis]|uniref:pre-rRNA 2'-O-ribose RNA methyltransferase FTSJ3-like n=1 Tax=Clavelina lepadiformis TaxID=159417 RepID=UPI004042AC33
MGKQKMKAKARKDKYYHLAKETGYRARSAFKLLQLNKKFSFLQSSQVLVDLCAAPGGWLQVASEHMPMSSIIIGVDLVPIRPIPRCITFQDDITKESCRSQIKRELHTWKVDCFLHDGAPNVGKNWLHDAYSQSVLTLHSLKLASEFLRKGGWFITKVFRSKDYQALMWVFGQLFTKVHATKPQASRNVSAEIFVVCQGFKAPDKIDKKFFEPKSVFQEVEGKTREISILDFEPKKKKPKAKGYEGDKDTLFQKKSVSEFLECSNPLKFLSEVYELKFYDPDQEKDPLVTEDILANVKDIRSLGKKEIKALLNWHKKFRKQQHSSIPVEEVVESESSSEDSDEEMERKIQEIKETEAKTLKKKKRTVIKERNKLRERMSHMAQSTTVQDDMELFALDKIKSAKQLSSVMEVDGVPSDLSGSDAESGDEDAEISGSEESVVHDEDADEDEDESKEKPNPLLSDDAEKPESKLWFNKEIFKQIEEEMDEVGEVEHAEKYYKHKNAMKPKEKLNNEDSGMVDDEEIQQRLEAYDSDSSDSDYDVEKERMQNKDNLLKGVGGINGKIDAEGLALGTVIVTSRKQKREVIDDSFNRYTFNEAEGDLPDWFVEDERKRVRRTNLDNHISKDLVDFYKSKDTNINVRTIKKVAEAKARKKKKLMKKVDKARKQAEGISDTKDMSNKEKAAHIKGIYKKAGLLKKQKEETTYVFAKRGTGKRVRRPPGVSGKFKVVDKRMKKDLRSDKGKTSKSKRKMGPSGKGKKKH